MKKYALITENSKELSDWIQILNYISSKSKIEVSIVSLSDVYQDKLQDSLLQNIHFPHHVLIVENPYGKPFIKLNKFKKICLVLMSSKKIYNFVKSSDILLSGVQTIFERVLYQKIKKFNINLKTIVYHRHLIFDDLVGTKELFWKDKLFSALFSMLGFGGFFIKCKAVGFADKYIVLGKVNEQYLLSKGVSQNSIYPLGSLEYDFLPCQLYKLELSKKKICYITGAFEWIGDNEGSLCQIKKIKSYIDFFSHNLMDYEVWIRVHPRENIDYYMRMKDEYPFLNLQFASNNKILFDINEFDFLIGGFSTVLFEALLINKQIIFYILDEEKYRYKNIIKSTGIIAINDINNFYSLSLPQLLDNNFIYYDQNESALIRIGEFVLKEDKTDG